MALAQAIVARLVAVGLVPSELAASRAGYLHDEVLVKLPAGEHYDLHLSYLRLLLGGGGRATPLRGRLIIPASIPTPASMPLLPNWHSYCLEPVSVNDLSGDEIWKSVQAA